MTSAEEDLMALALRTKPHANAWLCLSPMVCTYTHLSEKLVQREVVSRRHDA